MSAHENISAKNAAEAAIARLHDQSLRLTDTDLFDLAAAFGHDESVARALIERDDLSQPTLMVLRERLPDTLRDNFLAHQSLPAHQHDEPCNCIRTRPCWWHDHLISLAR